MTNNFIKKYGKVVGCCLFIILLFLIPKLSFANTQCSKNGYTVLIINGILTNDDGARQNVRALKDLTGSFYNNQPLTVDYVLNPTHSFIVDSTDTLIQKYFNQFNLDLDDSDFAQMLTDASTKVTTQKLLLVGHSQGNFYANTFYDSVADMPGGVPSESIGVYGVATPADHVAGNGSYLTSDTDVMIAGVVAKFPFTHILKPNVHIDFNSSDGDILGHDLSKIYLKYEGAKIVSDIQSSLDKLKNNNTQAENSPCLNPPKLTLTQKMQGAVLSLLDQVTIPTQNALVYVVSSAINTGVAIANTAANLTSSTISAVDSFLTPTKNNLNNLAKNNPTQIATTKNSQPVSQLTTSKNISTENFASVVSTIPVVVVPPPLPAVGKGGGGRNNITLTENNANPNSSEANATPSNPDTTFVVPPASNPTYITYDSITADTTWDLAGSPYIVENGFIIEPGFTLTIKPGVVVKFSQDTGLDIFGSLIANGDADNQIYFTLADDVVDGNTWQGMTFINASDSSITNAVLEYTDHAFYLSSSKIILKNLKINDNGDGITLNNSVLNANGVDCVGVSGACLTGYNHSTINWENSTIDYEGVATDDRMSDAIDIFNYSTLDISNTSINFNSGSFSTINVYMNSSVTADHVNIQGFANYSAMAIYDDSNLTLTNSSFSNIDSDSSALYVFENSTASVDNLEIDSSFGENDDAIYVFSNSHLTLKNSLIKNSSSLYESTIATFDSPEDASTPSTLSIEKTVFEGGASTGISVYCNENISVTDSVFKNFTDFAIQNLGTSVINVPNNFWNDKTGPHNSVSNPNGLGEEVSDNVLFAPWCADETCAPSTPPVISSLSLSSSSTTDIAKIGDSVTLSIVADAAGYTAKNISINNVPITNFTDNGDGTYTALYTVSTGDSDVTAGNIPVNVILVNAFGNSNVAYTTVKKNTLAIDTDVYIRSSNKQITAFNFLTPNVTGVFDDTNHTIALTVPYGTDVKNLISAILISDGSLVSPNSNIAQDFTNPVIYTVTAQDQSKQNYTVTVTVASKVVVSSDDTLSSLSVNNYTLSPAFSAAQISYSVVLPAGTTAIPTIITTTTDVNATETITPATSVTGSATVTVKAQDATTTQTYTINFSVATPVDNTITQLKIITPLQSIPANTPSNIITVESQNSENVLTKASSEIHVNLVSSSITGVFTSGSASDNSCGTDWTKTSITISTTKAHESFCYKDSTSGAPTITVSASGLSPYSQVFTIN